MQFFQVLKKKYRTDSRIHMEFLSLLESLKSSISLDRHERGAREAIFITTCRVKERRGDMEPEERRDRLLAVTELHLFGPPSKKVIFFQGGNFQTPTVTAPCRKRAALCPRLSLPSSHPPRFASLFLSPSRV